MKRSDICKKEKCSCGFHKCRLSEFCISHEYVCDGISHCPFNDDEEGCGSYFFNTFKKTFTN